MAPLEQHEKDAMMSRLLLLLEDTKFACSSLTELGGGSGSFTFRGALKAPATSLDGAVVETVIVKHSTDFAAVNKDFPMPISRALNEGLTLDALRNFSASTSSTAVEVPRLYLLDREANTRVLEDFPGSTNLMAVITSPRNNERVDRQAAVSIGRRLGSWLRSFHTWADEPAQASLRNMVGENEAVRQLKHRVGYGSFLTVLEGFPDLLEGCRDALEKVREVATEECRAPATGREGKHWGLVHGDFWTGNVLAPITASLGAGLENARLSVIDWEFAQLGHRSLDLGQIICDFYERQHFKNFKAGVAAIEAFADGYGEVDGELAFSTAIYTGVHLICWCTRRPPVGPLPGTQEEVWTAMRLGRDLILKGVEKDAGWFLTSPIAALFKRNRGDF